MIEETQIQIWAKMLLGKWEQIFFMFNELRKWANKYSFKDEMNNAYPTKAFRKSQNQIDHLNFFAPSLQHNTSFNQNNKLARVVEIEMKIRTKISL